MTEKFIGMLREAVDLGPGEVHAGTSSREVTPGSDSSKIRKCVHSKRTCPTDREGICTNCGQPLSTHRGS